MLSKGFRIWRCRNRKFRWAVLMFMFFYAFVCLTLMAMVHNADLGNGVTYQWLPKRKFDPFQSDLARKCVWNQPTVSGRHRPSSERILTPESVRYQDGCLPIRTNKTDIVMESVWDEVSVGYPHLVLSVTGWHEVVQVTSWSAKPLHVIVVPFSHQDPGWTDTLDGYFGRFTANTLNQMVSQLTNNPSWRFVWSEIVFLHKWWQNTNTETKQKFKRLLDNGQLELLTGGWVMADEATTNFAAMLDQLIEGQQWVKDTFNYSINSSWSTDQFGHSSTLPYLLGQSGIHGLVITRAHFAVRRNFAKHRNLEFFWAQGTDEDRGIFSHMTPFLLYGIPYSCGPDRHVCCKFDFSKKNCFLGKDHVKTVTVNDDNVQTLSRELWEQLQMKAELFRSNIVLVPHGDDFRYNSADEWSQQFGNLEKIFKYINNSKEMNTKIHFGTISDYFKALWADKQGPGFEPYPTLSGDMLTYSDRSDQYWAGFFTSRPFYKRLGRVLQASLRLAEMLFTRAVSVCGKTSNMTLLYSKLETARRGLALYQHHDAITGTSLPSVMTDFGRKLHQSLLAVSYVERQSLLMYLVHRHTQETGGKAGNVELDPTVSYDDYDRLPTKPVLTSIHSPRVLLVTNPLAQRRHDVVHVHVRTYRIDVTDDSGKPVRYQIGPVWRGNTAPVDDEFKLSIVVSVPPFSEARYFVHFDPHLPSSGNHSRIANITQFMSSNFDERYLTNTGPFTSEFVDKPMFAFSNTYFTAFFSTCDGMLKSILYHVTGQTHKVDSHFVTYTTGSRSHPLRDKSGAYIFLPDGPARDLDVGPPIVMAIHGDILTEVRTIYRDILHVATIYNIKGPLAMGVAIDNEVNLSSSLWDNMELGLRFGTDVIDDQHSFCVDVNGFKMQSRKTRAKMSIQGNFHPVTQMAYLESSDTRFTVMTTETHGAASLVSGWLEMILDRRLTHDDWRGLNKGVTDNIPTRSTFYVMFEQRTNGVAARPGEQTCLPTHMAETLCRNLNNPLSVNVFTDVPSAHDLQLQSTRDPSPLPCDINIVNIRMIANLDEALVILHRVGLDCGYQQGSDCPNEDIRLSDLQSYGIDIVRAQETVLTGVTNKREVSINEALRLKPMKLKTFNVSLR